MRTWFQCMRKFVKFNYHYYYVQERGTRKTLLVSYAHNHQFALDNFEFDGCLRNGLIELLPE